jgi:transketolase N-terminal domain/subunit
VSAARSLFDTIDIDVVEARARRLDGPGATLVAAFMEAVLTEPPHRLVVGSRSARPTVAAALSWGWTDETAGRALGVALGIAAGLGGRERIWCLLDADSCDEGGTWEAARAAAAAPAAALTAAVLVPAQERRTFGAFWDAAGWTVREVDGGSAWEIVGGLDQATAWGARPLALLVVAPS